MSEVSLNKKFTGLFTLCHTVSSLARIRIIFDLFFELGAEANARGTRALPLLMREPNRVPDHTFSGLDLPHDEGGRRRFFGEY